MLRHSASRTLGPRLARVALAAVLLLAGLSCVLSFVTLLFANLWPGPFEDYWADMPLIEAAFAGRTTFDQWILAHNNAHRIFLPRLLFLADYRLADGTNLLLATSALIVKLALLFFLNGLIRCQNRLERLLLNTLILLALFNHSLVYLVVFSVNIQWELMILLSCLAIASFHRYLHNTHGSPRFLLLAYGLAFAAMLSHAGGFFCWPVFAVMALFARARWWHSVAPLLLFGVLFYLTFYVLPVSHTESSSWESILIHQFIMPVTELVHFFRLLSVGIHREFPVLSLYFSGYVLVLIVVNGILQWKLPARDNTLWWFLVLFLLLVMFITSAARISWEWNAGAHEPRFRILGIFLLLTLTLQSWQLARQVAAAGRRYLCRGIVMGHAVALLLVTHTGYYQHLFLLSNNTLSTHAYMLLQGATRPHGAWLGRGILHREKADPVARSDAFFRQHGLAWHHNKVRHTAEGIHSFHTGDSLFDERSVFESSCLDNRAPLERHVQDDIPVAFTTSLTQSPLRSWWTLLHRDSYFALDDNGRIIGYAYIYSEYANGVLQSSLRGMAATANLRYIAEISDNRPTCLFRLVY